MLVSLPLSLWLALTGCSGPNSETTVAELRVLSMVIDPPEAVAPSTVSVRSTVFVPTEIDPSGPSADSVAMTWTCTDFGSGCVEAQLPNRGATVGPPVDGALDAPISLPAVLADVVRDGTTVLPIPVWTLACAPGLCDIFDQVAAPAGTEDGDAADAFLSDPFTAMESLPLVGTSLAFSLLRVSARPDPIQNPVLAGPEACSAAPGASTTLSLFVTDADGAAYAGATAYGYASAGGFSMTEYSVNDGAVELEWFAPSAEDAEGEAVEVPESAVVFVIVNGEEGGSALFEVTCAIEPR